MPPPAAPPPPRLLDRVRAALRTRHCSLRTEKAYVGWIRRFILFHGKRHPAEMGAPEITRFLSALAIERNVADARGGADRHRGPGRPDPPAGAAALRRRPAAPGGGPAPGEGRGLRAQPDHRAGKGAKDRVTMLPAAARDLAKHLEA